MVLDIEGMPLPHSTPFIEPIKLPIFHGSEEIKDLVHDLWFFWKKKGMIEGVLFSLSLIFTLL